MLDAKDGALLVRAARGMVTRIAKESRSIRGLRFLDDATERNMRDPGGEKLRMRRGVFVTIKKYPGGGLRGCVGFISPTPLWDAVQRAAAAAAFGDYRFAPLSTGELDDVVFEVSVMTEPALVEGKSCKDWKKNVKIGRDGLIIIGSGCSGLLLPQVPIEQGWDVGEFFGNVCYKAGLSPEALHESGTKLLKFECQVFAEAEPNGKVEEAKFSDAKGAKK